MPTLTSVPPAPARQRREASSLHESSRIPPAPAVRHVLPDSWTSWKAPPDTARTPQTEPDPSQSPVVG